jgi:hypothetical protein
MWWLWFGKGGAFFIPSVIRGVLRQYSGGTAAVGVAAAGGSSGSVAAAMI